MQGKKIMQDDKDLFINKIFHNSINWSSIKSATYIQILLYVTQGLAVYSQSNSEVYG